MTNILSNPKNPYNTHNEFQQMIDIRNVKNKLL